MSVHDVCVCVFKVKKEKRNRNSGPLLRCFQTKCLRFYVARAAEEGWVLHGCRVWKDFGLLGVDIWL